MRGKDDRCREQDAIYKEARRLASKLGVQGHAEYAWKAGYIRRVSISFEDAETLIERLRATGSK